MDKKKVGIFILILLICFIYPASATNITIDKIYNSTMSSITRYVGGYGPNNYTKIVDAIDNSSDGDTVFVYDDNSPYYENLWINKLINLIGENKDSTIIESAGKYSDIITIRNDSVHISNFTIKYSGPNILDVIRDGINLYYCNNVSIKDINFIKCGLSFDFSYQYDSYYHNNVTNNNVNGKPLIYLEDKTNETLDYQYGQVILVRCNNINISYQNISYLRCGIILYLSNNCNLYKNQIMNASYGVLLFYTNNNILLENILSFNYCGIAYGASSQNIFIKNIIESNSAGINDNISPFLSMGSSEINITNNFFRNNNYGIWIYWTLKLYINYNEFKNNKYGIIINVNGFLSEKNIENNNFYSNKRNIWIIETPKTYSEIYINGNYWGKPLVFPKIILGLINFGGWFDSIPWFFIDWHPAKEPNDI